MSEPRSARHLMQVLEITRAMVAAGDLDSLLGLIIDRSMELLDAERASLLLYDAERGELVARVAAGVDELRVPADKGIAGETVRTGASVNVPDAYADPRFNPEVDRRTGFSTRSILSVPLCDYAGELVGVLQVLNKRGGVFEQGDVVLAETLAAQAGVALQRAQLIEHYLRKQEMERAMAIAREIQQGLMPDAPPRIEGFDVAGFSRPADETGGDVFDFFEVGDGSWGLLLADASGHGIGPALVIAEARAVIRTLCRRYAGLPETMSAASDLLCEDLASQRFVTCFLGLLDPVAATLSYASAGHGPLLFYHRDEDRFEQVAATGVPLGIMPGIAYEPADPLRLQAGDLGVFITDGFFEAVGPDDEPFGIDRVADCLRDARDLPAAEMIARLDRAVRDFTGRSRQDDDLTAVVVKKA